MNLVKKIIHFSNRIYRKVTRHTDSLISVITSLLYGTNITELLPQAKLANISHAISCDKPLPNVVKADKKILILTPVKNAMHALDDYFKALEALTYPKKLIDIAFLESDSRDNSYGYLEQKMPELKKKYHSCYLEKHDFHFHPKLPRWDSKIQKERRINIAKARNILIQKSLKPQHDYVCFIDSDLIKIPSNLLETLIGLNVAIAHPNCVRPDGSVFDLNAFVYVRTAKKDWKRYIKDSLLVPPVRYGRLYLDQLEHFSMVPLDSVGATVLMIKSEVLRAGVDFPETPFHFHLETEGFAFKAREYNFECWGLPNLKTTHSQH